MATFGGDGVTGQDGTQTSHLVWAAPGYELLHQPAVSEDWRRRSGSTNPIPSVITRCVLCGGIMFPEDKRTAEHTIPQWLHKLTGAAKLEAPLFGSRVGINPTWGHLALDSHSVCNSLFGKNLESRSRSPFKKAIEGSRLHVEEIEILFDLLDKVRVTAGFTANAFAGYPSLPSHSASHFPEYRVGACDRLALFFRVSNPTTRLMIFDPFCLGFLYTPSAIGLLAQDVVMISVSTSCLLSPAFGLRYILNDGTGPPVSEAGTKRWERGLGWRSSRIPAALTLAQPMRRQEERIFGGCASSALKSGGDGHVFQLEKNYWTKRTNVDFGSLPVIPLQLGFILAYIEIYEWLILIKQIDNERMRPGPRTFMDSIPELWERKLFLLEQAYHESGGLAYPLSDRPLVRSANMPSYWRD